MNVTGNRIREFRTKLNLTLDDVAKHLGVGRQAIYKYEQGTVTNIPLENLEKMAQLFGTTPSYLAGWQTDEERYKEMIDALGFYVNDPHEKDLISVYRSLSLHGKEVLLERAKEIQFLYGKKPEDTSAQSV